MTCGATLYRVYSGMVGCTVVRSEESKKLKISIIFFTKKKTKKKRGLDFAQRSF